MASLNHVLLMGNLTRDPALRQTPGGLAVADLGLAINETYKTKDGQAVEKVCFTDIVVWGRQAETCTQYLTKGAPVMVEGRLEFDQWQTPEGEKRSRLRVRAHRVQFLSRPGGARDAENGAIEAASAATAAPAKPGAAPAAKKPVWPASPSEAIEVEETGERLPF